MTDPLDASGWDDHSLTRVIDKAQHGCVGSQEELFSQVQAYLLYIANQQFEASGKAGASDIVQQSMIQAVENINDFRGKSFDEFKGWLRQIVVNEARQTQRRFSAGKRDVRRERHIKNSDDSIGVNFDFADSLPTPGTDALAAEQANAIQAAMERLPDDYQQVIKLRNWEKLQFGEIAERMGLSVSGAAKLWYRALAELKKQYGPSDG